MSRALSDELGAFTPLEKPYDLRTADEGGRLRIVGYCRVGLFFRAWRCPAERIRGCGEPEERHRPDHREA
jgi:hypothetical protein